MGKLTIEKVVKALQDGGIPTSRGMPAGKMAQIAESVAAVNLQTMDLGKKTVTVLVTILTPASLGAAACEEMAFQTAGILNGLDSKTLVQDCNFISRANLFATEITVQFDSERPKITIDQIQMRHVVSFSSWRDQSEETISWVDAPWYFELEEFIPAGEDEDADPEGTFQLMHISHGGSESFVDSRWTYQRRDWDGSGMRQVRRGIATRMDNG